MQDRNDDPSFAEDESDEKPAGKEAQDEIDEEEKYKKFLKQDIYDDSNDILTELKNEPVEVLPEIEPE